MRSPTRKRHHRLHLPQVPFLFTQPGTTEVTPIRPRAYSDSKLSPSLQPTSSAYSPLHLKAIESSTRGNMPPPANPASAAPAGVSTSQMLSDGTASTSLSAAAAPSHHNPVTESDSHDIDHLGSSSPLHGAGAFNSTHRYVTEPAATMRLYQRDSDSGARCLHCGKRWEFPPINTSALESQPDQTSDPPLPTTIREMTAQMDARTLRLTDTMDRYRKEKDQSYEEWMRWHQVEPGEADSRVPCMLERNGTTEATSSSNKRKADVPIDDQHISKLCRLSCSSPPRNLPPSNSQLTPPPDPPYSSSPTHLSTNHDAKFRVPSAGDVEVDERLAVILGLEGAPLPILEKSPNDSTSMFHLPERRSKSTEREKTRSASPSPVKLQEQH
ncbi:hypothetical protein K458DRAFT_45059 [Lentithecium fluviatile CBS 122367]|uniref:Uncharacterized protein n=1 Tax=Lentithecium fluviatile CBS 122367 TaxID=1168545 RepID=A0A6G1IZF8_9PLEO|nr:hypothetical protein K458DRAFT_45059 [Lentithecium fluviatile CBS 122367]